MDQYLAHSFIPFLCGGGFSTCLRANISVPPPTHFEIIALRTVEVLGYLSKARLIISDAFALLTRGGPPLCSVGVVSKVLISLASAGSVLLLLLMFCKGNDLACW